MPIEADYQNERVVVSGGKFERCSFMNCELVFDGTPADIKDCKVQGCHWTFQGTAATTLEFVASLCKSDPGLAMNLGKQLGIITVHEQAH